MRCERCGTTNPGASWYCSRCGAPLDDLNVADSHARRPLPTLLKWSLVVTAVSLLIVSGVAVLAYVAREGDRVADIVPVDGSAGPARSAIMATPVDGSMGTRTPSPTAGVVGTRSTAQAVAAVGTRSTAPAVATVGTRSTAPTVRRTTEATASATARATAVVRVGAPEWSAPRMAVAPKMDGRLDEWTGDPLGIAVVVFGSEFWNGPEDLSATAFVGWDDDALYVAVQVVDDYFSQPSRGRQLHLSDSIELQLDVDLAGDFDSAAYSSDDWQIGVSPGDFAGQPPDVYVWRPLAESISAVRTGSQRLDNGYIVEFAVPWTMLGFDPARTRSLGFALSVSDNDDPRPAQLTMISAAPNRSWGDPRSFATLVLND